MQQTESLASVTGDVPSTLGQVTLWVTCFCFFSLAGDDFSASEFGSSTFTRSDPVGDAGRFLAIKGLLQSVLMSGGGLNRAVAEKKTKTRNETVAKKNQTHLHTKNPHLQPSLHENYLFGIKV